MLSDWFQIVFSALLIALGLNLENHDVGFVELTQDRYVAEVAYVIDGDTFDTSEGERIRLLGIDTPERNECYYVESSYFVKNWLEGKKVFLEKDVRDTDVYGRSLRYVFINYEPNGVATSTKILVNKELLKRGYADYLPIGPDRRYRLEFRDVWDRAKMEGKGRWSECIE